MFAEKFVPGSKVLCMTVTSFFIGQVVSADHEAVVVEKASWVGCTGSFKDFLAEGKIDSFDPIPEEMHVTIYKQSIVNTMLWPHALPGVARTKGSSKK